MQCGSLHDPQDPMTVQYYVGRHQCPPMYISLSASEKHVTYITLYLYTHYSWEPKQTGGLEAIVSSFDPDLHLRRQLLHLRSIIGCSRPFVYILQTLNISNRPGSLGVPRKKVKNVLWEIRGGKYKRRGRVKLYSSF